MDEGAASGVEGVARRPLAGFKRERERGTAFPWYQNSREREPEKENGIADQSRAEQSRAEQSRAEQSRGDRKEGEREKSGEIEGKRGGKRDREGEIVENRVRIERSGKRQRTKETERGRTMRKSYRCIVCMWFTYVARQDACVLVRCIRDTYVHATYAAAAHIRSHTLRHTYTRGRVSSTDLCAFNYSQRGPWGNWGMGWDKGVKIIARSSLEADRWLLHSPLHLLPSTSLCPYPRRLPYTTYVPPPALTFTDPWDSLTGQTKNGRFEAHPPLPRLTSGV